MGEHLWAKTVLLNCLPLLWLFKSNTALLCKEFRPCVWVGGVGGRISGTSINRFANHMCLVA